MSLWSRLKSTFGPSNSSLAPPDQWLIDTFLGGLTAKSGVQVTELTALGVPTVYACVNVISDTLATLPLNLYRKEANGSKHRATGHPLNELLSAKPNSEMTAIDLMGSTVWQLCLHQKTFIYINRNGAGSPAELWPIEPKRVRMERSATTGRLEYYIDNHAVDPQNLIHLRGPTTNGISSVDTLYVGRDSIGLAISLGDNAAEFFKNGSKLGNVYTTDGTLGDQALLRLKQQLKDRRNTGKDFTDLFLEEGMKLIETRAQNKDAQFIESRKYQDERIAAIFKVPPHKVGILDRSTNNNIEHQGIEFVQDTILPWARRLEKTLGTYLLTPAERSAGYFFEFLIDGLLRGDLRTRYDAYAKGRQWGWLSANDIRRKENMDPIDDGDEYLKPLNMIPAGAEADSSTTDN